MSENAGAAPVVVRLSASLRAWSGGPAELPVAASTVRGALDALAAERPAVYRGTCDERGAVRRHVNLFVNDAHIRDLDGLDTALAPGDVLTILPAVSGG
jgi:molybdopterin converting factor small subunit